MNVVTRSDRVARTAAVLAAIGFAGLAVFQAALAVGAPWGRRCLGWRRGAPVDGAARRRRGRCGLFRWGTWLLAVVMLLGAVPNFASQSRWENFTFGPLALVLAGLCVLVARGAAAGPARGNAHAAEP